MITLLFRFVDEFYKEPWRGYGANVVTVFEKLRESQFRHIYDPAREQFDGRGSYGNGGAMRIAPMALFCCHLSDDQMSVGLVVSFATLVCMIIAAKAKYK
jgi:poly(ADP-ribose) glycohydrolase ARH3